MEFDLSEEIIDAVIFAIQDQNNLYWFDTKELQAICSSNILEQDTFNVASERYVELPKWKPANGFYLMETFVASLHNPIAREALRQVLDLRKGVFRTFKDTLKTYPEVEKRWLSFRDLYMRSLVIRWYNELRESAGLEKIGEEPEEYSDIIQDDFVFRIYCEDSDTDGYENVRKTVIDEIESEYEGCVANAFLGLWDILRGSVALDVVARFIAETHDGEIAAVISASSFTCGSEKTVLITELLVQPRYRGLGLANSILQECIQYMAAQRFRWVIFSNPLTPSLFVPILLRQGFVLEKSLYILDMSK